MVCRALTITTLAVAALSICGAATAFASTSDVADAVMKHDVPLLRALMQKKTDVNAFFSGAWTFNVKYRLLRVEDQPIGLAIIGALDVPFSADARTGYAADPGTRLLLGHQHDGCCRIIDA